MTTIRAFDGYLVGAEHLRTVVSPAYDSLTSNERHAFGLDHPLNYINAMRSADEFPEGSRPSQEQLLQVNAAHLRSMLDGGKFEALERPCIFIYRLAVDGHQQTAIVCEIPIDHYASGKVLKHEKTRSDKEDLLADYLEVLGVSSSPVCLAYAENPELNELIESVCGNTPPVFEFTAHDDVLQSLWRVDDEKLIGRFSALFSKVEKTYLTDGHHRFAAGSRYAQRCRAKHPDYSGEENFNYVLVALFSAHQLRILPYNRCVKDLNGMSVGEFIARVAENFTVTPLDETDATPAKRREFGMYVNDKWYRLNLTAAAEPGNDPVDALDVTILQDRILCPILGITDVRSDARLDYVTGDTGLPGLEQKCGDGWAVGFACFPTSIDELMRVADSDEVMPPKSTYFDPKMRSGIFLRLY